ncbi:hypothetical protein B0H19DRAFT_1145567 [Mycena capillaripes]|nr:hypothetical protein B0H19DRAFT_1145567 [Mycena capillaripes]
MVQVSAVTTAFLFFVPPPSPLSFVLIPVCASHDSAFNLITSATSRCFALSFSLLLVSLFQLSWILLCLSLVFPQLIAW